MKNCIKNCDISHLRVFGCLCYSSTILADRKNLDSCVVPRVFLGFKPNTKGFLFLNLKNHKIDLSRNVVFHEICFPYHSKCIQNNDSTSLSLPTTHNYSHTYDDFNVQYENNVYDNDIEINTDIEQRENVTASLRHSTRNRKLLIYLQDFEVSNAVSTKYPIHSFLN